MTERKVIATVRVVGLPVAKGNMRRKPGGGMYDRAHEALGTWTVAIHTALLGSRGSPWSTMARKPPIVGPVGVNLTFYLVPPRKIPANRRGWPAAKPDRDKLERAVFDALTGIVYVDDAQVVDGATAKLYAVDADHPPGVFIQVFEVPDRHD